MTLDDPKLESLLKLRKAMRDGGLREPRRVAGEGEVRRYKIEGVYAHVIANFPIEPTDEWKELKSFQRTPAEISIM